MNRTNTKLKGWLILLAMLLLSNNAYSEKYLYKLINNIYYTLDSETKEAEVVSFTIPTDSKELYAGDITIPAEVTYNEAQYAVTAIGSFAFENCTQLVSIALPETIKSFGTAAFRNCSSLTSIIFPNSLTTIEGSAFSGCNGLASIEIPNNVTDIGYNAFESCANLQSVTLSTSIKNIGNSVFSGCTSLTTINNSESLEVLSEWLFKGCSSLETVNLSSKLQSIPQGLFNDCTSLTEIMLPKGVTAIGDYVFYGCTNLKTIHAYMIQPPVINSYFFKDVPSTAKIYVPLGSENAYTSATGWKAFTIIERVELGDVFTSKTTEGADMFFTVTDTEKLECEVGRDGGESAVSTDITGRITIPKSIKLSVGDFSVVRIGGNAFKGCSNFNELIIPESIKSIEYVNEVSGIESYSAFSGCNSLNFIYSQATTAFATSEKAFDGIPTDAKLYVPIGAKKSYESTNGWSRFGSINEQHLENDIITAKTAEGVTMFFRVISVKDKTCEVANNGEKPAIDEDYTGTVTIPSEVESMWVVQVGELAFAQCKVSKINMPEKIEKICQNAFAECVNLASINLPNSVTEIEIGAFGGCMALASPIYNAKIFAYMPTSQEGEYTIPSGITTVLNSAFSSCTKLTKVNFPNSLVSIEASAFSYCTGLTSLVIPGSVTSIGKGAFYKAAKIETVEFQHTKGQLDALTWASTDLNDFNGPSGTTLKFSADVANKVDINYFLKEREDGFRNWASAGKSCFYNIEGSSLFLKVTNDGSVSWIPVSGTLEEDGFVVWNSPVEKNTAGVLDISKVNTKKDGSGNNYPVKTIQAYAFFQYPNLTSVIIGDNVTTIGREAFAECTNLTSVTIGKGLTSLSRELFRGCSKLASVTIPEGITTLAIGVFIDCTGLTSVSLPKSLTTIEAEVFYNCPKLEFLAIPDGVKRLEKGIFVKCDNITVLFPQQLEYIGQKTLQGIKCAIFTNENIPEVGSGSVEYTVNQISVPMKSLDSYTGLFASNKAIGISSYVGYETTPAEISITNSPITSCKATAISYSLQNGEYVANDESCSVYGLTPESVIEHTWELKSGNRVIYKGTTAGALTFETLPADVISDTKAQLNAKTNGDDDGTRFGFEWRRYDAPDEMPSYIANCGVSEGYMAVALSSLSTSTYYKYRPFYKADDGNVYYGEWIAFITADASVEITPITISGETSFSQIISTDTDLSNSVIDNTYYNMDATNGDGYDATEQALVLNSTTSSAQMSAVQGAQVGDAAVRENFSGIIFEIPAGQGVITVDAKTIGTHVLNVQIGNGAPTQVKKSERGTAEVEYNVSAPTYVYLYASTESGASARLYRGPSAGANSVLLYGYKVQVGGTGIEELKNGKMEELKYYDLNGRKVKTPKKGVYIINGKKVIVK